MEETCKIIGPEGCGNQLSFGGETFESEDGVFEVPALAAAELIHHGFSIAPAAENSPAKTKPSKK